VRAGRRSNRDLLLISEGEGPPVMRQCRRKSHGPALLASELYVHNFLSLWGHLKSQVRIYVTKKVEDAKNGIGDDLQFRPKLGRER
jgi:hypothetical protein